MNALVNKISKLSFNFKIYTNKKQLKYELSDIGNKLYNKSITKIELEKLLNYVLIGIKFYCDKYCSVTNSEKITDQNVINYIVQHILAVILSLSDVCYYR